jgi:Concanavalin A-like lectin/glucanases superfamily
MLTDANSRDLANFFGSSTVLRGALLRISCLATVFACMAWGDRPALAAKRHEYTFNGGNANDSVGSAHGTLVGGATATVGQAHLDGVDGYVDLPAGTIGLFNYPSATLEAWFTNTTTAAWQRLFDFGNTVGANCANCFFFSPATGASDFRAAISNTDPGFNNEAFANGAGVLPANTQHYIAVTVDDTSISLYRNGQLVESTLLDTAPQTLTVGAPSLGQVDPSLAYLGRSLYTADAFFTGSINQFTIHDNVLTPAQIQANFTAGPSGPKGPTLRINRDSGAVTLLNEQTGVNLAGYTITSAAGAFDSTAWRSIANFADANNGG